MKNSFLLIAALLITWEASTQSKGSFEQFCYVKEGEVLLVPMARFQNGKNWYAEVRYNYEEVRTISMYGGKEFSKKGKLSLSLTPMLGAVMGKFNGGSLAANITADYSDFSLSSQSQYTISTTAEMEEAFFYTWTELRYYPTEKIFAGISLQHTSFVKKNSLGEPGVLVGLSFGKWSFPLYVFNPTSNDRYFALAINLDWENKNRDNQ